MVKKIKHPELNAETEVQDESVDGWLEVGWQVQDDENVSANEPVEPVVEE